MVNVILCILDPQNIAACHDLVKVSFGQLVCVQLNEEGFSLTCFSPALFSRSVHWIKMVITCLEGENKLVKF